jgi:hypothetical protein
VVLLLAERLDLPSLLGLTLQEEEAAQVDMQEQELEGKRVGVRKLEAIHSCGQEGGWSAFGVCQAWAEARSYTTARTSRPDSYRWLGGQGGVSSLW